MNRAILSIIASAACGAFLNAEPMEFDFKDPKGVNNIVFLSDAPLESINGTATGISGTVQFDPKAPEKTTGKIVVEANSLRVPNPDMQDHLKGEKWLHTAEYPNITFEIDGLSNVKKRSDGTIEAKAEGTMTVRGESRDVKIPVTLNYLEGKLADRQRTPGDILVVRSNFEIKRSDYGINANQLEDKVSDTVNLRLSLAGAAPKES